MANQSEPGDWTDAVAAIRKVNDPTALARLAALACARIDRTTGHQQMEVLTQLVHTVRAVADAAERTAGHVDSEVSAAMWRLSGAVGTRFTREPLPVLRGEALPEPDKDDQ